MSKYTEEQLCNFWYIQLQLFQLSTSEIVNLFYLVYGSNLYIKNEYSKKFINKYLYQFPSLITEDDKECLATHIAMQLTGL